MLKISIDVGGTFTDPIIYQEGVSPRYFITPSTPQNPSQGVMQGLREAAEFYEMTLEDLLSVTDLVIYAAPFQTVDDCLRSRPKPTPQFVVNLV